MAVQGVIEAQNIKTRIIGFRVTCDKEAVFYDQLFQEAAQEVFRG